MSLVRPCAGARAFETGVPADKHAQRVGNLVQAALRATFGVWRPRYPQRYPQKQRIDAGPTRARSTYLTVSAFGSAAQAPVVTEAWLRRKRPSSPDISTTVLFGVKFR